MDNRLISKLESGFAAQQRGDLGVAESHYRDVLAEDPKNPFALNLVGVVLIKRKHYPEAVAILEQARDASPDDPETHANLGLACARAKMFSQAIPALLRSLDLKANQPAALNNLGNAYAALDNHADAVTCFEKALRSEPTFADCLNNLASSYLQLLQPEKAMRAIDRALKLAPNRNDYLNTKGEIQIHLAQYEQAKSTLECALAIGEHTRAQINLSTVLKQQNEFEAAKDALHFVIEREPDNAEAHHHLGVLEEQLGDSDAAAARFCRALACSERYTSAWYQLAKLRNVTLTAEQLDQIQILLKDETLLEVQRSPLYFALAASAEKDRDYASSIAYFSKAQAIKAKRQPYDGNVVDAYRQQCEQVFTPIARVDPPPSDNPVPIFVIGMPRSGTTLTEQILCSHPSIAGAGEVGFIHELISQLHDIAGQPFPKCVTQLNPALINRLRDEYFSKMRQRCGDAPFIVDKNPLNFNFVGLVAQLFPEAKLLYCLRDPIDNCVSIFRLPFDDNQGYSHDLASLGSYYRAHEALMALWHRLYEDLILTVRYEETVDDLESQSRQILEFVGAPFDSAVLKFHENQRAVMTPSAEQVRQAIYATSSNYASRYGNALIPLKQALKKTERP